MVEPTVKAAFGSNRGYARHHAIQRTACENDLVVFEEIPPRRAPRSQRFYISYFAFSFAFLAVMAAVTWAFLPHPLSIEDKFVLGGIAFTSLISGVFLLNAKAVTARDNQERLWYLFSATMFVPLICDVFGLLLR